jgi:hypothetical protein
VGERNEDKASRKRPIISGNYKGLRTNMLDSYVELHPSFLIKLLVTPSNGSP